jgi:hypothetical protein
VPFDLPRGQANPGRRVGTIAQFGRTREIVTAKRARFSNRSEGVIFLKIVLKKFLKF